MEEQIVVALTTAQVDWLRGAITQRLTVESDPGAAGLSRHARRPVRAERRRVSVTVHEPAGVTRRLREESRLEPLSHGRSW